MEYSRRKILAGGTFLIASVVAGCSTPFSDDDKTKDNTKNTINQLEPQGDPVKTSEESDKYCDLYAMNITLETVRDRLPSPSNGNVLVSLEPLRITIHIVKNEDGEIINELEHDVEMIQQVVPRKVTVNCADEMRTFYPELVERITVNSA